MDIWEATKVVYDRVRELDPRHASKIVGMLLIQDYNNKELIRLAFCPDHHLQSFVARMRAELAAKPSSLPSPVVGPSQTRRPWGMPSPWRTDGTRWQRGVVPCRVSTANDGHRRSFSLSDAEVPACKPCMYLTRGFCKNGSSCRFLHVLPEDDAEREMAVMRRAKAMAAFPFAPSPRGLNFMFQQQQQGELQRSAAAMLQLGGEDMSRFSVRSPRVDRGDLLNNSTTRQIYLTFPADSTFTAGAGDGRVVGGDGCACAAAAGEGAGDGEEDCRNSHLRPSLFPCT